MSENIKLRPQDRIARAVLIVRGRCRWWVIPVCPFCGKKHTHGAGHVGEDLHDTLGWRTPHCITDVEGSYCLVDVKASR